MTELRECPFCGGKAEYLHEDEDIDESGMVACVNPKCGVYFNNTYAFDGNEYVLIKDAVSKWNQRADGWISVNERLPEEDVDVLVNVWYAKSNNVHIDYLIASGDEITGHEWNSYATDCVTHWRPLPAPPKEE